MHVVPYLGRSDYATCNISSLPTNDTIGRIPSVNVCQPSIDIGETFLVDAGVYSREDLKIGERVVNTGKLFFRNVEGSVNVTDPAHFATGLPRGISLERLAFFKHVESEMY